MGQLRESLHQHDIARVAARVQRTQRNPFPSSASRYITHSTASALPQTAKADVDMQSSDSSSSDEESDTDMQQPEALDQEEKDTSELGNGRQQRDSQHKVEQKSGEAGSSVVTLQCLHMSTAWVHTLILLDCASGAHPTLHHR